MEDHQVLQMVPVVLEGEILLDQEVHHHQREVVHRIVEEVLYIVNRVVGLWK